MVRINKRDELEWEPGLTVARLLERMNFIHPHLVMRVNGAVVSEEEYVDYPIPDGAEVSVIHLIAGG